jgi:hypothetical protein
MRDRRGGVDRARQLPFFVLLGVGFAYEMVVLFLPRRASFHRYPLGVPNPLVDVPPLKPFAVPMILACAALLIVMMVRKWPFLVSRPGWSSAGVFALGVGMHVALLGSLSEGFSAFHRRAVQSGHAQYLHAALEVRDLGATLRDYERFVSTRVYLATKGPGVLVLFHTLATVANAPGIRVVTGRTAPAVEQLRAWVDTTPFSTDHLTRLRHLLGLLFIISPLLTCVPVFVLYATGREFGDGSLGLLAAVLYLLVPGVALHVAHLDFFLFPALATGVVALFMTGIVRRRPGLLLASAVLLAAYFTFTLAAAALVALLLPFAGMWHLRQPRSGAAVEPTVREALTSAGVMVLGFGAVIAALSVTVPFDFLTRYTRAQAINVAFGGHAYNGYWMTANLIGWLLAFGLAQAFIAGAQCLKSLWAIVAAPADALDVLAVAWICLIIGLELFAQQHGETNRIWTFLSPVGCLLAARFIRDSTPAPRYAVPLVLFLTALVIARYRLSYL